jgi:chromate reductase
MHVIGMSGSLRAASFNTAALRAAIELAPPDMTIVPADLSVLPLFNADLIVGGRYPPVVEALRSAVRDADAVLFASPEYNHSVSGVLKNAIDWLSRPPDAPIVGKPGAILGASIGRLGTVRGQAHLRQVCHGVNMALVTRPEVMIAQAAGSFDADGRLIDETARSLLTRLLAALDARVRAAAG